MSSPDNEKNDKQELARVMLARQRQHEQVEFPPGTPFPEGRRGGGKTSLHLRRGSVRDVTVEELEYIRKDLPELYACLDVLPAPKISSALKRRLASMEKRAKQAKAKSSKATKSSKKAPSKPKAAKSAGK